jgi:hypothetical protein
VQPTAAAKAEPEARRYNFHQLQANRYRRIADGTCKAWAHIEPDRRPYAKRRIAGCRAKCAWHEARAREGSPVPPDVDQLAQQAGALLAAVARAQTEDKRQNLIKQINAALRKAGHRMSAHLAAVKAVQQ